MIKIEERIIDYLSKQYQEVLYKIKINKNEIRRLSKEQKILKNELRKINKLINEFKQRVIK